jgi:hypothetical protein
MSRDLTQQTQPSIHWKFPETAKFGRVIPKEKLYKQAGINAELKQLFVEQVGQIKWAYKLAENTVNLDKTDQVHELEVIKIKLKVQSLDEKILRAIDKVIPHQTVFILSREVKSTDQAASDKGRMQEICYQAAHKVKRVTDNNSPTQKEKWQQSIYLKSQWLSEASQPAKPLPAATNLERLYNQLLEALIPVGLGVEINVEPDVEVNAVQDVSKPQYASEPETAPFTKTVNKKRSLEEKLVAIEKIEALNKQINQVKAKRDKEKQFNRRRELNDQFKVLKKQLSELTDNHNRN